MKRNKIVKVAAAGAAAALLAGSLAACGDSSDKATSGGESGDAAGEGQVYYLNFKPEASDDWKAVAAEYTKETGVPVTVETAAGGNYAATLKSEMAKSNPPTLFQVNGPVGLAIWDDYAADLGDTDVYKALKDESMALTNKDGVAKGIPYAIETYGIIYNKQLLEEYIALPDSVVNSADEINNFETLKAVAEGIQANKDALGVDGAFTSAGMDSSSDWRFKTHLANLPLYYEFEATGVNGQPETIEGTYLDGYQKIFDLYINNSTTEPTMLSGKTIDDANSEFALGKAVFYQNGTWAYNDVKDASVADEDLGMLPIYIGAEGEENQGLTTGSENFWVINSKVSEADQQASLDFLNWVITSDAGRNALANDMGFVTPFSTFEGYESTNPLVLADNEYMEAGKTPVSWNFTVMPSDEWKDGVGAALLGYAEGGDWENVKTAYVDNWAKEIELSGGAEE